MNDMVYDKKIIIIDDEDAIRKLLHISLEAAGYKVFEASNGRDGIRDVISHRPDFAIIDLGLPDLSGIEIIKKIREWSKIPILVLTVNESDETKVAALDAGADDYLTKPFSVPELLARLRVAERHSHTEVHQNTIFSSGQLAVDLVNRQVKISNQEIRLTSTEYDLLKILVKNAGRVVTHRQLLNEVWGPNAVEHTQYLRVYMGHLRKKLEIITNERYIQTEPGIGYRLLVH